jgi:hypothetical protein
MDSERPEGPPVPPTPPVEGECCGRGCERCVWVYYHEARERYEAALAAWQASAETRA